MRPLDKLADVAIENLRVGDAAFRRKLKRFGYTTLVEAFDASDREVSRRLRFDSDALDALDALREAYEDDPDGFVDKALGAGHSRDRESPKGRRVEVPNAVIDRQPSDTHARNVSSSPPVSTWAYRYSPPMPGDKVGRALLGFEVRAKQSLDALADRGTDYLAFEAFEDFVTELGELSRLFKTLLSRYRSRMREGCDIIAANVPNAFIIFSADQARSAFDGENLWGNLFRTLEIRTQSAQNSFKRLMIECLESRSMPTYCADERDYYYFYTAMLHGGLTADLWASLWEKALLPMAKRAYSDPYAFGGLLDGRTVLALMREGRFSPNATVMNIIGKASEATMVPMMDAAMGVARRLSDPSTRLGVTMLSSSGLPDTALEALSEVRSRTQGAQRPGRGDGGRRGATSQRAGDLLYLPEGSLVLDLDEGQARIIWKTSALPDRYMGDRVDFFVNGELLRSVEVMRDVKGCLIEGGSSALPPMPGYEVEIKLMHEAGGDVWNEEASLEQVFTRTKPGCLEFLQMPDGTYRLRRPRDRITRTRNVAYVIKPGREVVPGPGMRPIEKRFTSVEWGDRMIWLFELDPGSSGSIVETETGRRLATWQEDVTVSLSKQGCIGSTSDGLDLYGVRESLRSDNESLPVVTIDAADGMGVLEDLDVVLTCAGRRLSVKRRLAYREGETSASITLPLSEVAFFPSHAHPCDLVIRRKSQGVAVFTYSFAVMPVRSLALVDCDASTMVATYQLMATEPVWVWDEGGRPTLVERDGSHSLKVPLGDEWASLVVESEDGEVRTDARLRLAGVTLEVGEEALAASRDHPLSYADAHVLGAARGRIAITAHGACEGRRALVMLGGRPLLFRDMARPGTHYVNIFSPSDLLLGLPEDSTEQPLNLTVFFGDVAGKEAGWADLELLRCREGLGFVRPQVLATPHGHILYLGMPATCELGAEVFRPATYTRDERVVFSCRVHKGSERADVPDWLVRQLDARRNLWIRYFPLSLFGLPDRDHALTMPFER